MYVRVEFKVVDAEANNIAEALSEVAEQIAATGYTEGEPDRAPREEGPSIPFIVFLAPFPGDPA